MLPVAPTLPLPTSKFCIPDFISECPIPARINRHHKQACAESDRWILRSSGYSSKKKAGFIKSRLARLAARCYPTPAYPQIRVICDCVGWLFWIDDIAEEMSSLSAFDVSADVMNVLWHTNTYEPRSQSAKLCKDYWKRMVLTASPAVQDRFKESVDSYLQAVTLQAVDRETRAVPDPESYINLRRDTSGLGLCFVLIEYGCNLDIPEEVMDHPAIREIRHTSTDLVMITNDVYSYKKEHVTGDAHNILSVLIHHRGVDLQTASDEVGEMTKKMMANFVQQRENLPSWGPDIDRQVGTYVDGLASWVSGNLEWSFETERYFGKAYKEVRETRIVSLLAHA